MHNPHYSYLMFNLQYKHNRMLHQHSQSFNKIYYLFLEVFNMQHNSKLSKHLCRFKQQFLFKILYQFKQQPFQFSNKLQFHRSNYKILLYNILIYHKQSKVCDMCNLQFNNNTHWLKVTSMWHKLNLNNHI